MSAIYLVRLVDYKVRLCIQQVYSTHSISQTCRVCRRTRACSRSRRRTTAGRRSSSSSSRRLRRGTRRTRGGTRRSTCRTSRSGRRTSSSGERRRRPRRRRSYPQGPQRPTRTPAMRAPRSSCRCWSHSASSCPPSSSYADSDCPQPSAE